MTIGERIKEIRKKNGYTQGTLADELQVAKGTVSAWEIGSRRPSFEMLETMCGLFNVRMDYLIAQSDDATPPQEPTEADLNSMAEEGLARELVSKVQQMRKQNDYEMMDKIHIYLSADDDVAKAVEDYREYIMKETLAESIENKEGLEEVDLNGHKTGLAVERI